MEMDRSEPSRPPAGASGEQSFEPIARTSAKVASWVGRLSWLQPFWALLAFLVAALFIVSDNWAGRSFGALQGVVGLACLAEFRILRRLASTLRVFATSRRDTDLEAALRFELRYWRLSFLMSAAAAILSALVLVGVLRLAFVLRWISS